MKRRSLIKGVLAAGATGVIGYTGFKYYKLDKKPASMDSLEDEEPFLAYLAETIIPETDSPGAITAGVSVFMLRMLKDFLPYKDVRRFLDGMEDVKDLTEREYDKKFEDCTQKEREFILSLMEDSGSENKLLLKIQDRFLGRSFIRTLKFLVCTGFAYSKIGATQAFNYIPVPGAYHANIPLKEGQTSWILS